MQSSETHIPAILANSPISLICGAGALDRVAEAAPVAVSRRTLVVTDPAIRAAGHAERLLTTLRGGGRVIDVFDGVEPNPTSETIRRGAAIARQFSPDTIIGLGGGSAMDAAKGVNLLFRAGGEISEYRGDPPLNVLNGRPPLLPMVLIPTTAGTGSEAQSFALISDSETHLKLACGDRRSPGGLRPVATVLDPDLTATMPRSVAAATGLDALSHAVETAGCRIRSERSLAFSREAWARLAGAFERSLRSTGDMEARGDMLLGAHLAGCAIEASMLGAAHACANPLTARFDLTHGFAVGVMLPHVIRFNGEGAAESPYAALDPSAESLARRFDDALAVAEAPRRLRDIGVAEAALEGLASLAATQWTASLNPRPVTREDLLEIYRRAW